MTDDIKAAANPPESISHTHPVSPTTPGSARAAFDIGARVKFKLLRSYIRRQGKGPVFDEYSGKVVYLHNGNVVVEGVTISGLYNRPLSEIKKDDTLFGFVEET